MSFVKNWTMKNSSTGCIKVKWGMPAPPRPGPARRLRQLRESAAIFELPFPYSRRRNATTRKTWSRR
jgi:hypothetical protein